MTDPVKEISAMEACRNQTLSDEEPSPVFPINVKSSPSTPTKMADSVGVPENQSRNELMKTFVEAIDGTTPDSTEMIENSGSMDSIKEAAEALMAASQAAKVETAETVPMVIDWNQLPKPREQQTQLNDKLIDSFLGLVGGGVTREKARALLKVWNWEVSLAVNDFFDHPSHGVFSDEDTLVVMEMNWQENRRNQEAKIGNSSSSLSADPTETDPRATTEITFQVLLADGRNGAEEFMTFRSDQTLRDIRSRIAKFRPDDNRDYYLTSMDGGDIYDDLDITVQRIHCRGATKLVQVLSDS